MLPESPSTELRSGSLLTGCIPGSATGGGRGLFQPGSLVIGYLKSIRIWMTWRIDTGRRFNYTKDSDMKRLCLFLLLCFLQSCLLFYGTGLAATTTKLIESAKTGNVKKVSELLTAGAEINAVDNQGVTALSWSAFNGHSEIVKTLIEAGADINHKDNDGMTALMAAAFKGNLDIVKTLIKAGSYIQASDNSGRSALQMAEFKGHLDVIQFLKNNIEEERIPRDYEKRSLEGYLKFPEDKIDIAEGALLIEKELYPDLDIQRSLNKIDAIAEDIKTKLHGVSKPKNIIKTINRYLFNQENYSIDINNHFLNEAIDAKSGECTSLSCLYLAIGHRLQLPLYGVAAPTHIFVRFQNDGKKINIDPAGQGLSRGDNFYVADFHIPEACIPKGIYLNNLTKKQVLSRVLYNRGTLYIERGLYDKAINDFKLVVSIDGNYPEAYSSRGQALMLKGDLDEALKDFNTALSLNPNLASAYENRGFLSLEYHHSQDEAIKDLTKSISLRPLSWILNKDLRPLCALSYYNRGRAFFRNGDFKRAINDFNEAISLDPKNAAAYKNRGIVYNETGNKSAAIKDFTKVIALRPNDGDAYYCRGNIYRTQGEFNNAIHNLSEAISLNPDDAVYYYRRAQSYLGLGEINKALEDCNTAILLNSQSSKYHTLLGLIYFEKADYDKTIQIQNKAIILNDKNADAFFLRGSAYWVKALNDEEYLDKAITDHTTALSLNLKVPEHRYLSYLKRGFAYTMKSMVERGIEDLNNAISINPNDYTAYYFRSIAHNMMIDKDKMLEDLRMAIQLRPTFRRELKSDEIFKVWWNDEQFKELLN